MAKKRIHPSMMAKNTDVDDEDILIGGPEDGSPFEEPEDDDDFGDEPDELDDDDNEPVGNDRLDIMERRLNMLQEENAMLRRNIPPAVQNTTPPVAEEEPDWEAMLFTNPKETLDLYGQRIEERVTKKLRGEYNREQSQARFWNDFYKVNDDINRSDDHDIVEATLNRNFDTLAAMSTDAAIEKLGDLTRQRIMRYSKQSGKPRTRRMAEGAGSPTPKKATQQPQGEPKVASIGDFIRARRAKKASAA